MQQTPPNNSAPAPQAPAAPAPGTPEYDAAMAAKYDAHVAGHTDPAAGDAAPAPADSQSKPTRPDNVPEKFWDAEKGAVNVEALIKSYSELEKVKAAAPAKTPEGVPPATADAAKAPEGDAAAAAVASAGLDMSALEAEFTEKGELSAESIAAFEKVGISKSIIDAHIEGQRALAAQFTEKVYAAAGGADAYKAMTEWAGANLDSDEINAFNEAVNGLSPAKAALAVQGLRARYAAEVGSEGKLLGGSRGASTVGYASEAEMMRDMSDPKYQNDPAWRRMVEKKLENAAFWNT